MRPRSLRRRHGSGSLRVQDADAMRHALDVISSLHGRRRDGSCTCDTRGTIRHDGCPTALAVRHVWYPNEARP